MTIEKINDKCILSAAVLDHGFVRLVDQMGNDLSIVRNARVSYDADWRAGEDSSSDSRLINYLMRNGHNTPFEAVTLTFDIKLPIFVVRQWHRHRTWSYNEISARYKQLPQEFYVPEPHVIGKQNKDNKQMRDPMTREEYQNLDPSEQSKIATIIGGMTSLNNASFTMYQDFIARGVPRELARTVLPVATYTHMFATVNLHNLFKFLAERLHKHAQYEIRQYAQTILNMISTTCPVAVAAFKKQLTEDHLLHEE